MQEAISLFVYWFVIPIIMLILFIFAGNIVSRAPNPEAKTSAKAGFWAGLIIFIIFLIVQLNAIVRPEFRNVGVAQIGLWPVAYGALCGFLILLGVRVLLPTRRVGIIVLILVSASMCLFFSYIFIPYLRDIIFSVTLGAGLGALTHLIVLPSSVKQLLNYSSRRSS